MKFTLSTTLTCTLLAVTFINVHTLECFYCEGESCDNLDDEKLGSCGPLTFTSTTTTTTTGRTTTTPATPPSTIPASTSDPTTRYPTTTEDITTSSTPESEDITTISSSPASTDASTDSSADPTTTVQTEEATVDAAIASQDVVRRRGPLSAADLLLRNYRAISRNRRDAGDDYACYTIDVIKNGLSVKKHGCVYIPEQLSGCEAVRIENELPTGVIDNCFICLSDGCNSSSVALKISAVLLASLLLVKFMI